MSRHPLRKTSSDVYNSRSLSNDQMSIRIPEHITVLTSPKKRYCSKIGHSGYNGSEFVNKGSRVTRKQSNRKLQKGTNLMHSTSLPSFLSIQEAEFCELESFLSNYRYQKRCTPAAVKIQSAWRMYKKRKAYRKWAKYVEKRYRKLFRRWALSAKVGRVLRRSVQRKFIKAWRNQVKSKLRILELEIGLFEYAQLRGKLTPLAVNLFLKNKKSLFQKRLSQKEGPPRLEAVAWYFNPAYDILQECTRKKPSRVARIRLLHSKASAFIARRILQRLFSSWRDLPVYNTRKELEARFYIHGAVRTAFTSRPRWPGERVATIFASWSRWVKSQRHASRMHRHDAGGMDLKVLTRSNLVLRNLNSQKLTTSSTLSAHEAVHTGTF